MADIALDNEGDLLLDSTGSPVLVEGDDAIVQQLKVRFRFGLGDWFLDTRQGIPYLSEIFVKNPNLSRVRGIFRQLILTTPGIEALEKFDLSVEPSTRTLSLVFLALKTDGEILAFDDEFIIK